jgi:hypothetical protein
MRDLRRREEAALPASESPGRFFAIRLTSSLAAGPAVAVDEWFRLYRLVVPRGGNGRHGPRPLEQAWRARRLRSHGLGRREIAREMGWITQGDIDAAENMPAINGKLPHEARVASAEKRVRRNEKLLADCEGRIRAAGLRPPAWLAG